MDAISELLKSKAPSEPPQVAALKQYAKNNHDVDITVQVASRYYLIVVPTSSLAHVFRVETAKIIEKCDLDKKLVIHIG